MIGKNINGFHIIEKLDEGGMADVYKAVDLKLDREVAIKFLRINARNDAVSRKRFENEAKALAKLRHPNIVPVLTYGEYQGQPYLVMDYLPGGNLKQMLSKPIPWQKAAALLLPIAKALDYAHSKNIVHRDVKPSNILFNEDGEPMLTDFGVAKMLGSEETMDLTGTSVGIGTPYYMSPEQGRNKAIGPKSDIYSLGVVFYEVITGKKPFEAETPMAVILKHIEEPLPSPSKARLGVSRAADNIVFTALAKDPKDRYKSMREMAVALEKAADGSKFVVLPSRKIRLAIGIGVVLLGTLYLAYRIWPNREEGQIVGQSISDTVSTGKASEIAQGDETASIPPSTPELVYSNNFEDGKLTGFRLDYGSWKVVNESEENKVLEFKEEGNNWPTIEFGPTEWADGIIKYRFKFVSVFEDQSYSSTHCFSFRITGDKTTAYYALVIPVSTKPYEDLAYVTTSSNWITLETVEVPLEEGSWYTLEINATGKSINVFLDGALLFNFTDSQLRAESGRLAISGSPMTTLWFDDFEVYTYQN